MNALFDIFPSLRERLPWAALAALPTRVDEARGVLDAAGVQGELWIKRDDLASPVYGGNKVRLLEPVLGEAKSLGFTHVYASGARGSNFALATALHAPRVGLTPGVICFPQPLTAEGASSQRAVERAARVVEIAHWSLLPLATERVRLAAERAGERALVLSQVSVRGAALLGYVAAGLELARQVEAKVCPAPGRVVLPIGSSATTAGISAGVALSKHLGMWRGELPVMAAVRIAAWPLSRRARVLGLADKALRALAERTGVRSLELTRDALPPLELVTDQLGDGYPHPTRAGSAARRAFEAAGFPILDDTYSAKAAAHLFTAAARSRGPVLFWATKSSAPLSG